MAVALELRWALLAEVLLGVVDAGRVAGPVAALAAVLVGAAVLVCAAVRAGAAVLVGAAVLACAAVLVCAAVRAGAAALEERGVAAALELCGDDAFVLADALFEVEPACPVAALAGAEVEGVVAETTGVEPELLVLVERPCRANSHTPANSTTTTNTI